MKKLRELWKGYLLRPVLYQCVTKCAIALTAILLWDRYLNTAGMRSAVRDGGFIAAVILLGTAWIEYLRLDGVKIQYQKAAKGPRKKRHWNKSMADYADEHIVSWDELSGSERLFCSMLSSLLSALLFLIPALIAAAF